METCYWILFCIGACGIVWWTMQCFLDACKRELATTNSRWEASKSWLNDEIKTADKLRDENSELKSELAQANQFAKETLGMLDKAEARLGLVQEALNCEDWAEVEEAH